jgi:hypothetical protein
MNSLRSTLGAANSLARTFIAGTFVALMGIGSWFAYSSYTSGERELREREQQLNQLHTNLQQANQQLANQSRLLQERELEISQLEEQTAAQAAQIERLETAMRLLKVDHRLAQLSVIEQQTDEEGVLYSTIRFVEVNDQGIPIDEAREFRIRGDMVYVDYWVVKFDDAYVEQSDLDRSTSICLFRRIFGEFQEPQEGYSLDDVGLRPNAYGQSGIMSDFEQGIWRDFWEFANEPQRAAAMGIRAAHGEAVSVKLRAGKQYRIQLRASDGLSITPEDKPVPDPTKPTA